MADKAEQKTYALIARKETATLAAELRNRGNRVLEFPAALALYPGQAGRLPDPDNFDWIVFSDIFSAGYFFEAAERGGGGPDDMDAVHTCAAGEQTADHLRSLRAHADVVSQSPAELFTALSEYLGENGMAGLKILIPGMSGRGSELGAKLAGAGALVTELPVYERPGEPDRGFSKPRSLLVGGAVDEFIFSAGDDIENLLYICGAADIRALLSGVSITAVDESVAGRLRKFGLSASVFEFK